jgi:competence protein ComEA
MVRLSKREQVIVIGFLVLILAVSGIYMYGRPGLSSEVPLPKANQPESSNPGETAKQDVPAKPAGEVKVDVKGAVHSPGVYSLPAGARIGDAIQVAGGPTDEADLTSVNLAQKIADGAMVAVPTKNERSSQAGSNKTTYTSEGKININTATVEQLDALDGIGSTRAKAIVQYRDQNGPFQSVDDLLKVKGFGPKLLETIKDRLVVF